MDYIRKNVLKKVILTGITSVLYFVVLIVGVVLLKGYLSIIVDLAPMVLFVLVFRYCSTRFTCLDIEDRGQVFGLHLNPHLLHLP